MKKSNSIQRSQRYWPMAKAMLIAIAFAVTAPVLAHAAASTTCTPVPGKNFTWCVPIHATNQPTNLTQILVACSTVRGGGFSRTYKHVNVSGHRYNGTVKLSSNLQAKYLPTTSHPGVECKATRICGNSPCNGNGVKMVQANVKFK